MSEFDSPWKEAIDNYFEAFLAFFFPHAHADIDWGRGFEFLDKELQQLAREGEVGLRVVDKLARVWLKSGLDEWVLVHLEVQAQAETQFPHRVFIYHTRIFDRYDRKAASLAVLADERPDWRPSSFGYELWGCQALLRFPVVKLLDYAKRLEELEANTNPFALLVLAHLKTQETRKDPHSRREWKLRLAKTLFERGLSADDIRKLFRFIDWLMDLPKDLENAFWTDFQAFEQEKHMPYITSIERMGIEKGMQQGMRGAYLDSIANTLEARFGADAAGILAEIRAIQDVDTLRAVQRSSNTVATPNDLRSLWKSD